MGKLMGDSADEDRELIAQLVLQKMEKHCSVDTRVENDVMKSEMKDMDGLGEGKQSNICRTDSRESSVSSVSVTSTSDASSSTRKGELSTTGRDSDTTIEENEKNGQEGEDTMKNLRTSFAGLFGSDLK